MIPKFIKHDSIGDYNFYPKCETAKGHIWIGAAKAVYGHADIHLTLHYEGEADETPESLKAHLIVKRVVINGKSLDPHWHCLFTDDGVWYHWDGWFSSPVSGAIFAHPIIKGRNHRTKVETFTTEQERTLMDMGFTYLGEETRRDRELAGADLVAPILDLSVVKVVTTATLFRTPKGTELLGEMIELDHIKVINGDGVNLPIFLRPDQYTLK